MRISDWSSDVCSSDLYLGRPTQGSKRANIQQLSRRTVRARRIVFDCALESHNRPDSLGELRYGSLFAGANVDMLGRRVVLHKENAGICQIVNMEKLPQRPPRPPYRDRVGRGLFRLVEAPEQGGRHMARSEENTSELQSLMRNSYAVFC